MGALNYYSKAENAFYKVIDPEELIYARLYENIAIVLFKINNYFEAYNVLTKSLEISSKRYNEDNQEVIRVKNNIEMVYDEMMNTQQDNENKEEVEDVNV